MKTSKQPHKYQKLQELLDEGIEVDQGLAYQSYYEHNLSDTVRNLKDKGYPVKLFRVDVHFKGEIFRRRFYKKTEAKK